MGQSEVRVEHIVADRWLINRVFAALEYSGVIGRIIQAYQRSSIIELRVGGLPIFKETQEVVDSTVSAEAIVGAVFP